MKRIRPVPPLGLILPAFGGCPSCGTSDAMQGYYFSKPLPADAFAALVRERMLNML